MARKNKRLQENIQKKTAEKRKQEDALLQDGGFQDVGELSAVIEPEHEGAAPSRKRRHTSWEDEEQVYELKPRKIQNNEENMVEGLPIKINGMVARNMVERQIRKKNATKQGDDVTNESTSEEEEEEETINGAETKADVDAEENNEEEPDTEETIVALKEEIADLVEKIMENAEENTSALTRLCKMADSKNPNTCKFSMLSLVTVFRSIIPGYRIRPLSDTEKKEKVSKEVASLRTFEQNLVINYKHYIGLLTKLSKVPNNDDPLKVSLGVLAMQATNHLASNVSHFNFRGDVINILVRRVCKPNLNADPAAIPTIRTIETLFNDDDEGAISLEILRTMSKVVKVRNFNVEESVLNMILSLDILHDYDPNSKAEEEEATRATRLKKKDRVHLSKKQKKARKEMRDIEDEMQKAELVVSAEMREKNQAEILKIVLTMYLNILKSGNNRLVGSVLEGLSKFGNMASFDLLGDFLEVMKEIISDTDLDNLSPTEIRKFLLCIVSAFSLTSNNQHMKINMDLSTFVNALYTLLPCLAFDADIELSHKSLRLADPLNDEYIKPSVNVSTTAELLLKALDHTFFRSKSGTTERATAFTKRIYMCIEHTPEKTSVALLKFVDKLMNRYPEIGGLYSTEDRIGNGKFNMETDVLTRSNAGAATLWENVLLSKHYCPAVVKGVTSLSTRSKEFSN
ncbi:Noc3p KNAG_0M01800 [Huiozyma naganishii CBS 8797]|uniref:Nucleolar complex-associated protein 3 n=1 Tax=Huiozyma naganishii (strain ATCC MYA-139 / BCRC 22969 / CBS 8797 / KCTC 17520 / NBRC 10181 / NCYC 3082 / Yp74L-3) TaxID=1071383 RepID=J7RSY6_HUIN7|nr:hypothetical protein KNAG_0M01800 [Kazachstania naganishii CBS 8797]CCK73033.1 hypothetical protein KNAG_0M01800 [Kazachstania naganishii CBS 8797]